MAGPGRGRVSRSPNTEMARDNHLTHNSPPRGESCPPWPALITRLWCFSLSHAHTCNKLGISVTDCVTKCYKSLSHSVVSVPVQETLHLYWCVLCILKMLRVFYWRLDHDIRPRETEGMSKERRGEGREREWEKRERKQLPKTNKLLIYVKIS